jgi:hypothetical protein
MSNTNNNHPRPTTTTTSASQPSSTTPDDIKAARRLYLIGFFLLPWIWLLNVIQFGKQAYIRDDKELAYYVTRSLIGFIISTILLIVWIVIFQTSWRDWGSNGEALLVFNLPPQQNSGDW